MNLNYTIIEDSTYQECKQYLLAIDDRKILHRLDGPAIEHYYKKCNHFDQYYVDGFCVPKEYYEKAVNTYIKEQIFK